MVKVKINNNDYEISNDLTILEACHSIGLKLPTLCFLKGINEEASCRMCVVELVGRKNLVTACSTKVMDSMEILTSSKRVIDARKTTLELILANHNKECLSCVRNGTCELQKLCEIYDVNGQKYTNNRNESLIDDNNSCIVRDNSKCILCNRCVNFCKNIQGVEAIKRNNRGIETHIGSAFNLCLDKTNCVYCGGCVNVCPTGALSEKNSITSLEEALSNPSLHVVVGYAPSVRISVGESFGYNSGENVTSKLNMALHLLGFKKVFDINYGADLTVIEEGNELIRRLKENNNLPLLTSCCPAWVNYLKTYHKKYVSHLSSCKSPQQMFGAICKTYYAKTYNIDPKDIYVVSIMPCIAKKDEINKRDYATKYMDVDCVLTTRELIKLIKRTGLDFKDLKGIDFDEPMKGNSVIFGSSGGVMETSLRYVKEKLEKKNYKKLEFKEIRGFKGLKEASYEVNGKTIKVLVISGLKNANYALSSGLVDNYQFVEVMSCPSGCINGAGQPYISGYDRSFDNNISKRSKGLYSLENSYKSNRAKDNVYIKNIYRDYLLEPSSDLALKILHTKYHSK